MSSQVPGSNQQASLNTQVSSGAAAAALAPESPKNEAQTTVCWNLGLKIGFRFAFSYLVLYSFPFPLTVIPGVGYLFEWYSQMWDKIVLWVGAHVLHLSQPVQTVFTGSGDTTYAFILQVLVLGLAVAATLIWSIFDRRRPNYSYLHQWLRLYVRLVLGATLISYGSAKVIKSQFPDPSLWRLLEPYGDSSPMGLLWTFMGYSKAYNFFTGMVEMAAGGLIIIPRLATLGALLGIGAMGNVFILNMSYDVPVKLYSFNLLCMGVFLILPEIRRMADFFVLNRPVRSLSVPPLFRRRWLNLSLLGIQLVFLVYSAGFDLYNVNQLLKQYSATPPLYGIYSVDDFTLDGAPRPPLFTDEVRWRRFIFDRFNGIGIFPGDGPMQRYNGKLDLTAKTLELTRRGNQTWKSKFAVETPAPGIVVLNGEMDGKKIQARLRKLDEKSFPLNSRGFHWVNEFPYNR